MAHPKLSTKKKFGEGAPQANKTKAKAGELASEPDVNIYEETDECDLENSDQMIWLVKLPSFVQDYWNGIPSDSEEVIELGTVLINRHDPNVGYDLRLPENVLKPQGKLTAPGV